MVSYGSAQSNAMYSLAALAQLKGWKFEYYVQQIPNWLRSNPIGNYRAALELGMDITSLHSLQTNLRPKDYVEGIQENNDSVLVVPEGGYTNMSEPGIKQLALEILNWSAQQHISLSSLAIALPSGTGTTSLYLSKYLQLHGIEVLTCACVGGEAYLTEQFNQLETTNHPTILSVRAKHHFGHLYRSDYAVWSELYNQTQVEFDLLYDPYMWQCLQPWLAQNQHKTLLYIHQGGIVGNESMLPRYQRQFDSAL
ncbi:hypothetical protein VSA01S_07080 [Vibrio sagamiensis NBRC 104589]|uniref:1-aminocyclopropane-1-carboxylate deaminase n=1 Tax=Vibrio sagamiensis NBRC 104589 TaxID=1219064 RepID=A0A511QBK3_9VIBR|nr:hypothetical protein VSA01S_07080 [Vibrio sagamiensis NBRC 104589]